MTTREAFNQFVSPMINPVIGANDMTEVAQVLTAQEDFISSRNTWNPNCDAAAPMYTTEYMASDPSIGLNDPLAVRCAYLEAIHGITPIKWGNTGASWPTMYTLNTLPNCESSIWSLVGVAPTSMQPLPGEADQPDYTWCAVNTGSVAFVHSGERFYMNADWQNYENVGYGGVSNIARIDDAVSGDPVAAEFYMPYNSATVQSDGNVTGSLLQGWVVRFGQWLLAGNNSGAAISVKLPPGNGTALDIHHNLSYPLGSSVTLQIGDYAIFRLPVSGYAAPALLAPTSLTAYAGNARATLLWTGVTGAASYNIYRAQSASGPFSLVATGVSQASYNDTTPSNGGTYYYETAAVSASGTTGPMSPVSAVVLPAATLPAPWTDNDIGSVLAPGSASYSKGVFTVNANGYGIGGASSYCHYVYTPVTGPFTATIRVVSETDANVWSQAGLLVTPSLNPSDEFIDNFVSPSNGISMQGRNTADWNWIIKTISGLTAPYWLRIVRNGSTFTGYCSPDGSTWTFLGTQQMTMSATAYIGICGCAHVSGTTIMTSTYDNFSVTGSTTYLPRTTVSLSGSQSKNNWYSGPVTATLAAQGNGYPVSATYYTLDSGSEQPYNGPISISGDGVHVLDYWSVDANGDVEATNYQTVGIDSTPPTSTGSASANLITLTATDNVSEATTYYSIDGGAYQGCAAPFNVTTAGSHTISYYAVDEAGNVGATNTLTVSATPPHTTATLTGALAGGVMYNSNVVFALSATGANPIAATYYSVDGTAPVKYTSPFTVPGWGTHTVIYWSVDSAGNVEAQNIQTVNMLPGSNLPAPWLDMEHRQLRPSRLGQLQQCQRAVPCARLRNRHLGNLRRVPLCLSDALRQLHHFGACRLRDEHVELGEIRGDGSPIPCRWFGLCRYADHAR